MKQSAKFLFIVFLLLIAEIHKVTPQQKDFQCWPSAQIGVEIINNLKIQLEEEVRFRENSTILSRQINDIGATYRFNKYLKAGVFYRFENDFINAGDHRWRSGFYSDLALRYSFNRFTTTYRFRFQSARIEKNQDDYLLDSFRHRHKISVEYNVKGIPLVPFLDSEIFADSKEGMKGFRSWIGIDYSLNKIHTLTIKYDIDKQLNSSDPLTAFIIAAGYSLNLSLVKAK